jgi:AcrR family transcriptional regulator
LRNLPKTPAHRPSAKVVDIRRPPDTRDRVLQVAQMLFSERGYRGTSLRDIAKRIGIKAPSLLHHFPSKQQLYVAVLDRILETIENGAQMIVMGPGTRQEQMRRAVAGSIDFIVQNPDSMRLLWKEFGDESGVGRQLLKRRLPPLNAIAVNFIFRGQREGQFRTEVDPFHFVQTLNSITTGYFGHAAVVKRLWNINLLESAMIERRKREVIDIVERLLFADAAATNTD